MPLYTRRSQASVTQHGRSSEIFSTDSSPLRSFRLLPSYPSPFKRREVGTNASTSSFRTSYVMRDLSDTETEDSTETNVSQEFLKRSLLAKGHFEIDNRSSDSDSIRSDTVSDCCSYACEEKVVRDLKPERAVSKFMSEGTGAICCLAPTRIGQAWVCKNNNKVIHLYHRNGHMKESRTLNVKLEILAPRHDGVLFAIPHLSQAVYKMSPAGRLTQFVGFELAVSGIRSTSRNETIVATAPIKKSQKRGPRPRKVPSVLRLSQTGDVIWEIKTKGTEPFVDPSRIAVNKNGDICVIDNEPSRSHVAIFTPDGAMKKCYYGLQNKILECPFDPKDVCCDRKGRIYVADLHSSAVHVLDKQGNFVEFLVTKHDNVQYPTSLACDSDGYVWVGFSSGEIRVYEVEKLISKGI